MKFASEKKRGNENNFCWNLGKFFHVPVKKKDIRLAFKGNGEYKCTIRFQNSGKILLNAVRGIHACQVFKSFPGRKSRMKFVKNRIC